MRRALVSAICRGRTHAAFAVFFTEYSGAKASLVFGESGIARFLAVSFPCVRVAVPPTGIQNHGESYLMGSTFIGPGAH